MSNDKKRIVILPSSSGKSSPQKLTRAKTYSREQKLSIAERLVNISEEFDQLRRLGVSKTKITELVTLMDWAVGPERVGTDIGVIYEYEISSTLSSTIGVESSASAIVIASEVSAIASEVSAIASEVSSTLPSTISSTVSSATSSSSTNSSSSCSSCAHPAIATIRAGIQTELDTAWTDSNPNAPAVQAGDPGSKKLEQGGWVIWNCATNTYRVSRWPASGRASINPSPTPTPACPEFLVAEFHTHPNTAAEGYVEGPGTSYPNTVPGIVVCHNGTHYY